MSLEQMSLLYVEDEAELGKLMLDFLEDEFESMWVAQDGQEGLELYKKYNPDIVLSDIYMPKMDGLEMSKEIKRISPDQPVVLLTAFTNPEDMKKAIEIGIDFYINKPIQTLDQIETPLHKIAESLSLKKENEQLRKQMQIQERAAAVGEMIGNVAHQWRQPLGAIGAICSLMQLKLQLPTKMSDDELENNLIKIQSQTEYLSTTINNFTTFLKPELYDEYMSINLKDILEEAIVIVSSTLDENVEYITDLKNISLHVSKGYSIQIFVNLLENSHDAIKLSKAEEKLIFISLTEDDENIYITFRDSGGGVDETIIDKIFEPYTTTKHQSQGTGLGLYIVFQFVSRSRGNISVENVEFEHKGKIIKGAEFRLQIPKSHE